MNMNITKGLEELLDKLKKDKTFTTITPEVFIYWITKIEEGQDILNHCEVNTKSLLLDIESGLERTNTSLLNESFLTFKTRDTELLIQSLIADVTRNPEAVFGIFSLIMKILDLGNNSLAKKVLLNHNVNLETLKSYYHKTNLGKKSEELEGTEDLNEKDENKTQVLNSLINLTEKAKKGKIDPLIGRDSEIERVIQSLTRRRKNNPLLVGEPGVGKTAIAEGLALKIAEGKVPDLLKNANVYSLDISSLLSGAKYRGDFEKRLNIVIKKLEKEEGSILFIDEIHNIIGAGAAAGGGADAANILKPSLSNGSIKVIGSTTYKEKMNTFDKDQALSRRFQVVDIKEPSITDTLNILKGLKSKYEEHHNVQYTDQALEAAISLSVRYLTDKHLPDKAIDLMDEAGSYQKIQENPKKIITVADIEAIVAKLANIPQKEIKGNDKKNIKELKSVLGYKIFGQSLAVESLSNTIMVARAGIGDNGKTKPLGSFMFAGPTGVGKTELAKQLAEQLNMPLLRFDMSEYMEKQSVSRLIGSPPGYVGYEEGGLLTDEVIKNPYSVVLFDEVEKAHPDMMNITLQILDNGFLTDSKGHKVNFRNTIIIFTTNVGAKVNTNNNIGFLNNNSSKEIVEKNEELEKAFSPEFRNRLDKIITFNKLDKTIISKVVNKKLLELELDLNERNIEVLFSQEVRDYLADIGFDEKMGARPMSRAIQEHISLKLANEMIIGKLEFGGKVEVKYDKELGVFLNIIESFVEKEDNNQETITA